MHVANNLLNLTASNLQHAEDHMLLLGRKTALERVATFLLEMDRRLTAADFIALPMCRRDIADYLGLTLETVSRALSHLHDRGILGFLGPSQRQIVLLDRQRLLDWICRIKRRIRGSATCSMVFRSTSNSTAVDQPNIRMPFIAVIGPSRRHSFQRRYVAIAERGVIHKGKIQQIAVRRRRADGGIGQRPDDDLAVCASMRTSAVTTITAHQSQPRLRYAFAMRPIVRFRQRQA